MNSGGASPSPVDARTAVVDRSRPATTRAQQAAATRTRILDAARARFVSAHYEDVTLNDVAAEAGVTRQTVLNVFGSKDQLLIDVARSVTVPRHDLTGPEDRPRLVATVVEEYEQIGDALVRFLAIEDRIPAVAALLTELRTQHHRFLETMFADALPARGRARRRRIGEIHAALDVQAWKLLRRDLGFTVHETEDVLERFLDAVLAATRTNT